MPGWLLEVTDTKQFMYCPRIVYYRYCLPKIRPITSLMQEGIRRHEEEEDREERRNLHNYGLREGERFFHLALQSTQLSLTGKIDLVIAVPSRTALNAEAVVVEYKYSENKAGAHFKLQLTAYALLLEEAWNIPVRKAFLYSLPLRRAEPILITQLQRKNVLQVVQNIQHIVESEILPPPPISQSRCISCEFRRFCNDVV
jgi:CRISPR-associated exonuclease Cas4